MLVRRRRAGSVAHGTTRNLATLIAGALVGVVALGAWTIATPDAAIDVQPDDVIPVDAARFGDDTEADLELSWDRPEPSLPWAVPSAGCKKSSGSPSGHSVHKLSSGGVEREYRLYSAAPPMKPAPLVVNFHGRSSSAEFQERYSGLVPVAAREGFLLVSPEGTGAMRAWAAGATTNLSVDDVRFVNDLVDRLAQRECIDTSRVYLTGMSNGAFMASLASCRLAPKVAAVAMVAGTASPGTSCPVSMPVLAIHGTGDKIVPFGGGTIRGSYAYTGAAAAMASWVGRNHCAGPAPAVQRSDHVKSQQFPGCDVHTEMLVVEGGGHTWPGAAPAPDLGPTTSEFNAAETIWMFFSGQQRRER